MPGSRASLSPNHLKKIVIPSYAKVNLYLKVHNKRPDNYHAITTLFERISLHDTLSLKLLPEKTIRVISDSDSLPKDAANLAYRGAQLVQEACKVKNGVEIKIIKRIPIGAGLAGGSSNAAAALLGVNRLWGLGLKKKELLSFAGKIGSDVAFFIADHPFALGEGRGEKITPLPKLKKVRLWHVLAVPKIHVSTPFIYKKWDTFSDLTRSTALRVNPRVSGLKKNFSGGLTIPRFDVRLLLLALIANRPLNGYLFNSLEPVTLSLYPAVKRIKKAFQEEGVQEVLMSGSGPAVFGVTASKNEALHVASKLKERNKSWLSCVAWTV